MRYSRQREHILRIIKGRTDHPTADMIYETARSEDSTISIGTVYRDLKVLEREKQVWTIETTDTRLHYDGNVEPHCHYICTSCQTIYDIFEMPDLPGGLAEVGRVDEAKCVFYGVCNKCLNNIEINNK